MVWTVLMPLLLIVWVAFLDDLMREDSMFDFGVSGAGAGRVVVRGFASFPREKLAFIILGLAPFLAGPASQDAHEIFGSSSGARRGPSGSSCGSSRR